MITLPVLPAPRRLPVPRARIRTRLGLRVRLLLAGVGDAELPGCGTSFGSAFLTASRTVIQPPLAPGTAPSTRIRPRSTSVCTTLRLSVVTRSTPSLARHLLVLEGAARILAAAGRADRAMRDRHAMRGAQAAEIPALHAAGIALADRGPGHIDELADDEMIRGDLGADRDQRRLIDAEFRPTCASARPWRWRNWRARPASAVAGLRVPEPSWSAT